MSTAVEELERRLAELPPSDDTRRERVDLICDLLTRKRGSTDWRGMLEMAEQAEALAREAGYAVGIGRALTGVAFAWYVASDFNQALKKAYEALEILEALDDQRWIGHALITVFLVQRSLGNFDRATEIGLRVLKISEDVGNEVDLGWTYTGIGDLYNDLGDHERALHYLFKAVDLFERTGEALGRARAYTGIGSVYQALGEGRAALAMHEESLKLYRELDNPIGEARALTDLGMVYFERGELDRALSLLKESLSIRERIDSRPSQITSLLQMGRVYLAQKRLDEALQVVERARTMSQEIGLKPKLYQAHQLLSEVCEAKGWLQCALDHHKEHHRLRDAVYNEETNSRIKNLQTSYEVERSRKEAEIFRLKNVELASLLDELQQAQARLLQSERMAALGDLVAGVAHEMNSPLGVILSAAPMNETLAQRLLQDGADVARISAALTDTNRSIREAAQRIRRIVDSLRGFARLDEADYQLTDLRRGIEETLVLLEHSYRGRVDVIREYEEIPPVLCFAAELNQVFRIILQNAIEAIDGPGEIHIGARQLGEAVEIQFRDTGRGIPPDRIGRLFHPSFRNTGARVEARMGLFAAYQIVRKHGGEIRVASQPGQGTTFTIALPLRVEGVSA